MARCSHAHPVMLHVLNLDHIAWQAGDTRTSPTVKPITSKEDDDFEALMDEAEEAVRTVDEGFISKAENLGMKTRETVEVH